MEKEEKGIDVSAEAVSKKAPDKAIIYLSIFKKGGKKLQEKLREEFAELKKELLKHGISEKDIETSDYSMNKVSDKLFSKEYEINQDISVTVRNVENVGKIVDWINECGDIAVNNVQFGLDEKSFDELKLEAYKDAAKKLKEIAKSIAATLGVKLGKPAHVWEQTYRYNYPRSDVARLRTFARELRASEEEPSTEIKVHELSVTVQLRGRFNIS